MATHPSTASVSDSRTDAPTGVRSGSERAGREWTRSDAARRLVAFSNSTASVTTALSPQQGAAQLRAMMQRLGDTAARARSTPEQSLLEQIDRGVFAPAAPWRLRDPQSPWQGLEQLREEALDAFDPALVDTKRRGFGAAGDAATGAGDEQSQLLVSPCTGNTINVARRMLDRTTFGASLPEVNAMSRLGPAAYLEWQLDPARIPDPALEASLAPLVTLRETQRQLLLRAYAGDWSHSDQFIVASFMRPTQSRRQLFEKVVEFWSDHFNIYFYKDGGETFKPIDDRNVIRKHALGDFRSLLHASARSPSMLLYLDNAWSFAGDPNQNYARELLELHTLGVDNYTQFDIEEIARCFTGWSVDYNEQSPRFGEFIFQSDWHDDGPKTVLGHAIPAGGGIRDAERVLDILTTASDIAPITARFVARKMATRFWGYNPPAGLVQEIAGEYLRTRGDIRAMLRVALSPRWLACSLPKLKRPFELATSAIRAINGTFNSGPLWYYRYVLDVMGQHPFYWAPPNGYPEAAAYWAGHILPRWRFGFFLLEGQDNISYNINDIWASTTPAQAMERIVRQILGGQISTTDAAKIRAFLDAAPFTPDRVGDAVGLAMASNSFQWY